MRHPANMGTGDVRGFLPYLTNIRDVIVSTHKLVLCALLFIYKQVLRTKFSWLDEQYRPKHAS